MTRRAGRDHVLLAVGLYIFIWSLTTHGKYSDSGDEPHYLMVARSLVRDHDLDLANNYAAADALTAAGAHARRALDGTLQSTHDIGLPLLIAPIDAVAERVTSSVSDETLRRLRMPRDLLEYSIVSLTMLACVCAAFTWLAAGLARITSPGRALALTTLFAISPPILTESFLVFPETVALIVMCGVVWWLLTPRPRPWKTWLLAAALGYLPWCHRKFSPLVIACVAVMMWQRRDLLRSWSTSARIGLGALVLVPHVAFYWWTWHTWGNFGGPQLLDVTPVAVQNIPRGFAGLILDRRYGLVADAPIYLAIFAYWTLADRSRRLWLVVVASLVVPMSAYTEWFAGFSPPARYLVPILPLCFVALTDSLRVRAMRIVVVMLGAVQVVFTAFAWHHPRSLWPWIDNWNPLLRDLGHPGHLYARWLPMIDTSSARHVAIAATTLAAFNAVVVVVGRRGFLGQTRSRR